MWPPPVLPINRTNADPQQDTHPADHNALSLAMNDTVEFVRAIPPAVQRFPAVFNGITMPAAGGILAMTGLLQIPAVNYARVVQVRMHYLVTTLPSGYAEGLIRNNAGANIAGQRVSAANQTGVLITDQVLGANVGENYGGVMSSTSAVVVSGNVNYSQFVALAWPL